MEIILICDLCGCQCLYLRRGARVFAWGGGGGGTPTHPPPPDFKLFSPKINIMGQGYYHHWHDWPLSWQAKNKVVAPPPPPPWHRAWQGRRQGVCLRGNVSLLLRQPWISRWAWVGEGGGGLRHIFPTSKHFPKKIHDGVGILLTWTWLAAELTIALRLQGCWPSVNECGAILLEICINYF